MSVSALEFKERWIALLRPSFFRRNDAFTVPGARWLVTLRSNSAHMNVFTFAVHFIETANVHILIDKRKRLCTAVGQASGLIVTFVLEPNEFMRRSHRDCF